MNFEEQNSSLIRHARAEFRAAGWTDDDDEFKDDMQKMICDDVLDLLVAFSIQGHSGTTASYAINLFKTLASFEPIVPLTGEDWEWVNVADGVFQNKRCSRVFKQTGRFNGQAYDIEGIVFYEWCKDENGVPYKSHFTSKESQVPVTFPYIPKTQYKEYVDE
jgi:hypothetical protein